jgi:NADH dehydrogenase FAD-containing subunit
VSVGHVVLVGAGHANLVLVRRARRLRRAGLAVTLVDPDAFWYSGMAAAALGGAVRRRRDVIDPGPTATHRGVRFVQATVTALDPGSGRLTLSDGSSMTATSIVLNVGSDTDPKGLPTGRPDVVTSKPIRGLLDLQDRLLAGPSGARVVIVGGGATAVETAGNLSAGPVADAVAPRVTVVAGPSPLAVLGDAELRARLVAPLVARGVVWHDGPLARDITDAGVVLDDGRVLPAEHVLLATGLRASRAVAQLGLGDARGMPVTTTLQHPEHGLLFGAGDAVRLGEHGLPRLGVFAVRQAPVLLHNLVALHEGGALRSFDADRTYLTAVDLGGGDAVVMRGARWFGGPVALACKRLLDEWFLRRHRAPAWAAASARTVERGRS